MWFCCSEKIQRVSDLVSKLRLGNEPFLSRWLTQNQKSKMAQACYREKLLGSVEQEPSPAP